MSNKFYYQRGGVGAGFIFAAVIIGVVGYFHFYTLDFRQHDETEQPAYCVLEQPSTTDTITIPGDSATYGLIKKHAYIIKEENDLHMDSIASITYPLDGKQREVWKPKPDATDPKKSQVSEWSDPTMLDLRFVDVTDSVSPQQGIAVYNIYLKTGDAIPAFIKAYCDSQKPAQPLLIFQDVGNTSIPPLQFNTNNLKDYRAGAQCANHIGGWTAEVCKIPSNTTYHLFAYEAKGSRNGFGNSIDCGDDEACGKYGHAKLPLGVGGQVVNAHVEYTSNAIKMLLLFDTDPKSPYFGYQFNYAPQEYIQTLNLDTNYGDQWDDKTVQLRAFTPFPVQPWGWWTPECKPAVYLYPEKEMLVNVQVAITNGFLTYTDPLYPKGGWSVFARPNGSLQYFGNNFSDSKGKVNYATGIFPYLYYEGKVADSAVQKPEEGYVIAYENLANFYDEILPKLGLNPKESQEFQDYWLKALPNASYYFIGIIPQEQLNENEPLTITPKEDTMIRVRLYFEQREKFSVVTPPTLKTPTRNGFTVVDWGGMVKRDKDHPFTCVQ